MKATYYLYQIVDDQNNVFDSYDGTIAETREEARMLKRMAEETTGEKFRILKYKVAEYVR